MRTAVEFASFSLAKKRPDRSDEDYLAIQELTDWTDFTAIVADGVGSSDAPADAAKTAADSWILHTKAKFIENAARCAGFSDLHFCEITSHAYLQAHEAVLRESKGSACAVSVCIQGDRLLVGNVGDCRVYKIGSGGIEQLSQDQLDSQGDPTQVVGGRRVPHAYTALSRIQAGDVIILCSDGVWKHIEPIRLQKAASAKNAKEISTRLQLLLSNVRKPESDDATAVIALIKRTGKPFWEADSKVMDSGIKDDPIEVKLNAVFVELLNRLRTPLEKESARAEQVLEQINTAVRDLRSQVRSLEDSVSGTATSRSRPRGSYVSTSTLFGAVCCTVLVTLLLSWSLFGRQPKFQAYELKPVLPQDARVISQQYMNDQLQVKYLDIDGKPMLAVYKAKDGGRPSVIVDLSTSEKPKSSRKSTSEETTSGEQ